VFTLGILVTIDRLFIALGILFSFDMVASRSSAPSIIRTSRHGELLKAKRGKANKIWLATASYPARLEKLRRLAPDAAHLCDALAASPYDEDRKSEGVEFDRIDTSVAIPACKKAVAANPNASRLMFQLGRALARNGDYLEALVWYEKAAAQANTPAMINLAYLYAGGLGVTQDYSRARQLLEKAAAVGNAIAMTNLGDLFAQGHGVAPNYVKAATWYRKAAAKGDAVAMNILGSLYENGYGVLLNFAEARKWYEKAAAKGEAMALINLGDLFRDGRGVAQDNASAQEFYDKARSLAVIDRLDELRRR
jgi:TPR repeat protein